VERGQEMNRAELQDRLTSYLHLRQALGVPVVEGSKVLDSFVDFAGAQEATNSFTTRLVFDWLEVTTNQRLGNANRRLSLVRQFLLHLSAAFPETQVPELRLISSRRRPIPFVFTADEIELLLNGAAQVAPGTFFSVVLQTVIGLISATGLRASEALGLERSDVALQDDEGTLLIRESKFQKSRIVPLHPSTTQQLMYYVDHRDRLGSQLRTTAFFVSCRGQHLSYGMLRQYFRKIVDQVGIQGRVDGKQPTLHSLRHSFVVARLRSWHEQGLDVPTRLAHLATYLGHVDVRESYWYMTATPELLRAAAANFRAPACTGGEQ